MSNFFLLAEYIHYEITKMFPKNTKSVLDIGGMGRMNRYTDIPVTNANIKRGIDGCNLPYDDRSFDVVTSISTLEHAKDQDRFYKESVRVARKKVIHWYPINFATEKFKKEMKHNHNCVIPKIKDKNAITKPFITNTEHLLALNTIKHWDTKKVFEFMHKYGEEYFGEFLIRIIGG